MRMKKTKYKIFLFILKFCNFLFKFKTKHNKYIFHLSFTLEPMADIKINPKLLKDLKTKNINLNINHFKQKPCSNPLNLQKFKEKEVNQSVNSSDSLEKANTTISFKIRPCTPNPDTVFEKKNEAANTIRSAKTTLTTFPNYKKESIVTEKEEFQIPIIEDDENLFTREINEEALFQLCNISASELLNTSKVNLKVDLSYNSLQNLGILLPNLKELKVNGSRIGSLRDIGSSLTNLNVLWAARCSMQDLSGVMMFQKLTELYLSFNNIKDLYDIGFLESLQVLDLEGNEIDITNLEHLQPLRNLFSLNLAQNPISKAFKYPHLVWETLESLEVLDDLPRSSYFDLDLNFINKTGNVNDNHQDEIDESLESLLLKFGKYKAEINISEIKSKAEDIFKNEIKDELKEEDLILYSIKKSKTNKNSNPNESMIINSKHQKMPIRPKTASIFRPNETFTNNLNNFDNGMSSLVSSNDIAFSGNPLNIFKHKRKAQFTHETSKKGEAYDYVPNNIMSLIDEFRIENSHNEEVEELNEDIDFSDYEVYSEEVEEPFVLDKNEENDVIKQNSFFENKKEEKKIVEIPKMVKKIHNNFF